MAYEVITLNLIPSGEVPIIHAAQFDKARPLMFALKLGDDDFDPSTYGLELQIRKVDNNIVTATPASTSGNVVTFMSTEQMTACSGTNLGEIQITKGDLDIATLHFYLVVQRDVLAGGVSSASDIYNLTEQIAEIVPQVIGDNYYTKEEVDEKIDEIPTFDPTYYYDKSDVDALLEDKADKSELSEVAFSGNYNDLENKPDIPDVSNYYTKSEVDTKISDLYQIKNVSGATVHITDGGDNIPVKSFESEIVAVETGNGEKSPTNPYTISGFNSGVVSVNSNTFTFAFGQTVYGGHFDNNGNAVVTYLQTNINTAITNRTTSYAHPVFYGNISGLKPQSNNSLCECFNTIAGQVSAAAFANISNNHDFAINSLNTGDTIQIFLRADDYTDVASLKSVCGSSKIIFELANPLTLAITGQKIPTVKVCDISSNTGDVEVEYFTEKSDGIAELIKAFM